MNNRLAQFISVTIGTAAGCFLYAFVSLEFTAQYLLKLGALFAPFIPHGRSFYTPDDSWWPWPSLERNADRVPNDSLLQSATGILNLGQCVPIRSAALILPSIVGIAFLSVSATYLLTRSLCRRAEYQTRAPYPAAILLSTAIALPLTKVMHYVWQGLFNEVVFADADRWRAAHPGEIHISYGYPVALGTFGVNGIFLGAFFFQTACLFFATPIPSVRNECPDDSFVPRNRMRKICLTLSFFAVVFLCWPLIVGWLSRAVAPIWGDRLIPF